MEQNNNTFNKIRLMINSLEYRFSDAEYIQDLTNVLGAQFESAGSAEWIKEELSNFIFENDVLDKVHAQGYAVWHDLEKSVREIQHAIINFFGCDAD